MKIKEESIITTLFLVFNHQVTSLQEQDARASLGVELLTDLPPDLKALWRQIPGELTEIEGYLEPVKAWLGEKAQKGDYVLIQGDFGACFLMVNFAFEQGLIPVYSTTDREAVEEYGEDGSVRVTHRFRHCIFRRYAE